jgi:hypothetical protein
MFKHKTTQTDETQEQPRAGFALWSMNKDLLKWIIAFIVSALVGYGGAKVKLDNMQSDITSLKADGDKSTEQIVNLRIEVATVKAEFETFKDLNKRQKSIK